MHKEQNYTYYDDDYEYLHTYFATAFPEAST